MRHQTRRRHDAIRNTVERNRRVGEGELYSIGMGMQSLWKTSAARQDVVTRCPDPYPWLFWDQGRTQKSTCAKFLIFNGRASSSSRFHDQCATVHASPPWLMLHVDRARSSGALRTRLLLQQPGMLRVADAMALIFPCTFVSLRNPKGVVPVEYDLMPRRYPARTSLWALGHKGVGVGYCVELCGKCRNTRDTP